ncbi:MAG TPA: hypothetical protein VFF81_08325 [Noviherbaspirillum sp.]|nr:hypothetical protein [Noviherbaspirillum sp.]
MNIMVKPRPQVLADFNKFCAELAEHHQSGTPGVEKLVAAGLVEQAPGASGYRLTPAGEALRAAEDE